MARPYLSLPLKSPRGKDFAALVSLGKPLSRILTAITSITSFWRTGHKNLATPLIKRGSRGSKRFSGATPKLEVIEVRRDFVTAFGPYLSGLIAENPCQHKVMRGKAGKTRGKAAKNRHGESDG
jgi:hypothetical protein